MKLFVFERDEYDIDRFTKRINEWVNLHKEITIVDYNFGYANDGKLQTVVVKWK
ncbi:hypothetical protein KQH91_05445 [Lactobacillus johnsonii]|uniref:hypothetical protein n=1 Tax=Lactobacillus johnsonii TaxID=33959 RepID=UPI001C1171F8|nr:hypothetical protein [Lactobacillus johnsonii]MBU5318963.1 hypothetical protein [Lactobacillus johnsonii]MCI6883026.1 hypothetical protein [Lactobacillus johnsonii]MDY2874293.1 hypothetical protein [Lactobacillus johnsonii]